MLAVGKAEVHIGTIGSVDPAVFASPGTGRLWGSSGSPNRVCSPSWREAATSYASIGGTDDTVRDPEWIGVRTGWNQWGFSTERERDWGRRSRATSFWTENANARMRSRRNR